MTLTLTVGSISDPNMFAWQAGGTITPNQADPDSGTNASQCLENTDSTYHYSKRSDVTNVVAGPMIREITFKAVNGRAAWVGDTNGANRGSMGSDGSVLDSPVGGSVTPISLGNSWWKGRYYTPTGAAGFGVGCATGGTISYAADVTKGGIFYNQVLVQHRASAWTDAVAGYSMAQATAGSQPFVQKADGSSPGGNTFAVRGAVWQPNDLAKTMSCTDAAVLAALTGAAPSPFMLLIEGGCLGTPGASVPILAIAGTGTLAVGINTSKQVYFTLGSTTLTGTTVLDATRLWWAFDWDGSKGRIRSVTDAGVVTTEVAAADMTAGTVTPTSLVHTERCSAVHSLSMYAAALSNAALSREVKRLVAS